MLKKLSYRSSLIFGPLIAALTVSFVGCGGIDSLLEANVEPDVQLAMAVQTSMITAHPGTTADLGVTVTRLGEFHGAVAVAITGLPASITADVGTSTTSGQVSSTSITFHVGETAEARDYFVTVRGTGGKNGVATASVVLRVAAIAGIALTTSKPSLTIISGGIAPLRVGVARVEAPNPVSLTVTGNAGISAVVQSGTIADSAANITIAVAAGTPSGTYQLKLHGSSSGVPDCDTPLTVIVTGDALQLLASDVAALQASIASSDMILNRNGATGQVVFTATGLPSGVVAAFASGDPMSSTATVVFTTSATAVPGFYTVTIRATASDHSDATATIGFTINPSGVALSLSPQTLSMLQGTSASSSVVLARTAFTGPVAIDVVNAPDGTSIGVLDPVVSTSGTFLTVSVDRTLAPGQYTATIRATPTTGSQPGAPPYESVVVPLTINVLEATANDGNVLLDWSRCAAPAWVAAQDGTGSWIPLAGTQNRYRFAITTGRGAFAYSDGGKTLTVRYGTVAELSATTIDLCPAPQPNTFTVNGIAAHNSAGELFTWSLGGGFATTTLASPNFTMSGVKEGTHDLIGWGSAALFGARGNITRDISVTAEQSIGVVSLIGQSSFVPISGSVTVASFNNEARSYTLNYLTGASCDASQIYQAGSAAVTGTLVSTFPGVPATYQRQTDYHQIEITATNGTARRTQSVSFHTLSDGRFIALPTAVTPVVSFLTGNYRRLRVFFSQSVSASYNGALTASYSDGIRTTTIIASVASLGTGTPIIDMPDLSAVAGFPIQAAVPSGSTGNWTIGLTGSNGQVRCSEDSRTWSMSKSGVFP